MTTIYICAHCFQCRSDEFGGKYIWLQSFLHFFGCLQYGKHIVRLSDNVGLGWNLGNMAGNESSMYL